MFVGTAATSSRLLDAESGQQGTQTDSTETPLHLRWGTNAGSWSRRVCSTFRVRNVQPLFLSARTPVTHHLGVKPQSNHYKLQQVLQLRAMPKSLEYNTTLLSNIRVMPVRVGPVHRVVPTPKETLRGAGNSVKVEYQLDNRVNAPLVLHHNRPMF